MSNPMALKVCRQRNNLTVARGEKVIVCGPSGSGKSTMIRCISQLEEHDGGVIRVFGTTRDDNVASIDDIRREVGMVFQQFNLFPHMTVLENCTLAAMLVRKASRSDAEATAMRYLEKVCFPTRRESIPGSCPAVSSSASPSRGRCVCSRRSCCSTNQPAP